MLTTLTDSITAAMVEGKLCCCYNLWGCLLSLSMPFQHFINTRLDIAGRRVRATAYDGWADVRAPYISEVCSFAYRMAGVYFGAMNSSLSQVHIDICFNFCRFISLETCKSLTPALASRERHIDSYRWADNAPKTCCPPARLRPDNATTSFSLSLIIHVQTCSKC